jgi:HPr kinase/phosphorylase
MKQNSDLCLHSTCVALDGRALVIRGAAGSGKSGLALQLMAYGAELVADDRVLLRPLDGRLMARAPQAISGMIEARGVGILNARCARESPVHAILDLDRVELERLPAQVFETILGISVPVLGRAQAAHFAPALIQYLKCGAIDPDA